MLAPHIPHRIEKKVASRKKVGSAEKNTPTAFLNHEFIKEVTSHACRLFSKSRIYRIYQIATRRKPAIGDGVLWFSMQARRSRSAAWRQRSQSERASEVGCGVKPFGRDMPPLKHTMRHFLRQAQFFFGEADFFSAKRLFFRAARDVSGVRSNPPWARVEIKLKTCFWLYPNRRPTIGRQPSHPRPRLFVHFHTTKPTIPPQKKEHSLLVLPSVHTIINFATKFFEMFTKLQSENPHKVFQVFQVFRVFRVFQVFHFAFGPQNRPILVQIRTKQVFQASQAVSP